MAELRPLTNQQLQIAGYADRGYSAPEIAKALGISASQVYDQCGLIRKKGYRISLLTAAESRWFINSQEARRIADEARTGIKPSDTPDGEA